MNKENQGSQAVNFYGRGVFKKKIGIHTKEQTTQL
jgi:hypothetical protein